MYILEINNLEIKIKKKIIIKKINIKIKPGEIHVLMGPNGSGKSTISLAIAGNKKYKIKKGTIKINNKIINKIKTDERARMGLFISFQNTIEISGLNNELFLYKSTNIIRSYNKKNKLNILEFKKKIKKKIKLLNFSKKLLKRSLNKGFSGGEKKKNDILQILLLKPKISILDEIDSGLDIDSLKDISKIINNLKKKKMSFIIITHNIKIYNYINIDKVHILNNGKIIKSGKKNIIKKIEKKGYKKI